MEFIYQLFLFLYKQLIFLVSIWNPKAKKFIRGRKTIEEDLTKIKNLPYPRIWFHFPSLGEFEQGRPVLEKWKKEFPTDQLILTFYSPSGYEIRKHYPLASLVLYLPFDSPGNSFRFLDALNPSTAVFTKYDFWHFYVKVLYERNIPLYIISAIFRKDQVYFKPWGGFFLSILKKVSWFFVQNELSVSLLNQMGILNVSLTGDTRFDRVYENHLHPLEIHHINSFKNNSPVMVAGSTWPKDEKILNNIMNKGIMMGWKLILAPHEILEDHLLQIEDIFQKKSIRYSTWVQKGSYEDKSLWNVLIIDQIGILSSLYHYGDLAYIGNGFGKGIHNILEAAIFGKPVIFGPNYRKFAEAIDLVNLGAAFSFDSETQFLKIVEDLLDKNNSTQVGAIALNYCYQKIGATQMIIDRIKLDRSQNFNNYNP